MLDGEVGVRGLFFSPDGERIGFTRGSDGALITMLLDGGLPIYIAQVGDIYGAHWTRSNEIVYAKGEQGIFTVPAGGGKPGA